MLNKISQKELHNIVYYNEECGTLFWNQDMNPRGKKDREVGYINSAGYRSTSIYGKRYLVHRLIYIYHHGDISNKCIDHIDHNKLNNKIENLRAVSHQQNLKNRKISSNNASGYHGVSKIASSDKWRAYIVVDNIQIRLGSYKNIEDAVNARKEAEVKYGFHGNHGI